MTNQINPIAVFGDNECTVPVINNLAVSAIIDDYSGSKQLHGMPCLTLAQVTRSTKVVNAVHNSRAIQAQRKIVGEGFHDVIFIGDLIRKNPEHYRGLMLTEAYLAMQQDYNALKALMLLFADDQSRLEFQSILDFRNTLDVQYLTNFKVKIDQQYFDDFMLGRDFEVLIDGGAYDGADAKRFASLYPNYQQMIVLEPSEKNADMVRANLSGLPGVSVVNACLGSSSGQVNFSGDGTSAKISADNGVSVAMVTIDSLLASGKTLVKLDIEGAEMDALAGAEAALANPEVSFAISAYHLPHDLLDIFNRLRSAEVEREFYFRHYSGGIAESVLFALTKH